jgi:16S rRNA G966 N2-methylase RsmD
MSYLNEYYFFNKKGIDYSKLQLGEGSLGISSDKYGSKLLVDLIKLHLKKDDITITDMTANVGVDSIAFGLHFKKVNSIELNNRLFNSLNNNINVYNLKNIKTYNGSSVEIIKNLKQDVIYIDAPWGGEDYHKNTSVKLYLDNIELSDIYNMFKNKTKLFVLKVPKNYDINNFIKETQVNAYFLYPHFRKEKVKYIFMIIRL